MKRFSKIVFVTLLWLQISACGINNLPSYDEQVQSSWAQVQNQYQRRADLIPNLVATVKGYAAQEKDTLTAVVEARSKISSMNISSDLINNPQALQKFENAQSELSSALSRLLVVVERYPDLKSNQNFLALQSQLEGTENRIAVSRRDYIAAIQLYNTEIRTFPGRFWHSMLYSDMKLRESYQATTADAEQSPTVSFE